MAFDYVDRREFVISDAMCKNFRLPGFDVEDPLPTAVLGEWGKDHCPLRPEGPRCRRAGLKQAVYTVLRGKAAS